MPAIDWDALDADKFIDESVLLPQLLAQVPLTQSDRAEIVAKAAKLVERTRAAAAKPGVVEGFLQQFSLGTQEGLALMCLAEALLRTPDAATRDRLIAEKVGTADWAAHLGQSSSLFVNASTIGLTLTGKLVGDEGPAGIGETIRRLAGRLGEPVIRRALAAAVGIMGDQFVLGSTIEAALKRAAKEGYLCSFDMLGEGARTPADAERYEHIYAAAIEAVGRARAPGSTPEEGHGVSVKLSALCPRYEAVRTDDVFADLYPRMKRLALIGARHNLNLAIDAEEADRLALSLKLVDRLARESELGDWTGLGVVVQAYGKRARGVIDGLERLSRDTGRRIMVRLVKGAYWDSEVKRAQIAGHPGYPVFTSKAATDLSYLVCAHKLIAAAPALYPQFATHNAHSLMAVRHMADRAGVRIEHQRLHGMGEGLYRQAAATIGDNALILRAYAPVGGHEELLPYLVRRLLENGANSSFVNALLDEEVPATTLVADPVAAVAATPRQHPRLPSPSGIYPGRGNPLGRDYSIASVRARAMSVRDTFATIHAGPIVGGQTLAGTGAVPMASPVDHGRTIGSVTAATPAEIDRAAALARAAQPRWNAMGGVSRGKILRAMADALDAQMDRFIAILSAEAGKTLNDAVAEVREAIDFCRYYALLAETRFAGPTVLPGPVGEVNQIELHGRGVFVCISPWNFPLAIFTGQVAAALAAGNAVLAKPAEQTPLVAAEAVRLFHSAGLDPDLLALLPGDGAEVGAALVAHPAIAGVAFTGGTDTAWAINRSLANRNGPILPFIAETGGLNGLFVDTSALREQVVDDVLLSAFGSAGQRCSALRLLYLPQDTADATIETLVGAAGCMVIGDPSDPATDIGPVIDAEARDALNAHVERLEREAKILFRADARGHDSRGTYFAPVIAEVPSPDFLEREVFGPVLHVYRYDPADLASVAGRLAARGYGLTLGIHSRIDRFAEEVAALVPAGNVYVNRSIIGAVVGVQPFGGEGLSGTGPKAGGPDALLRYAAERSTSINIMAKGGDPALLNL
ncbi:MULTISPECIES: bifunctional proline dehydrogenase/L-glutamate gamma-semialdehyde dehydrogenase PutA [Sphingomonas]|jgi:RHH-type proline utilization regulon transcriptional repressor/proline dehydrogenase/delta 1-pyrroline-5-carboxylate dehydrogenase|uniref:Bifunctional protein PutA n=1 Tax=Sphingomonas hankookensis TaxID=563996 RepID=A0ABR5Y910_9SPHN|nr:MULTISPECIES: bifunctional proline dehydrogenase/L-glutamate gamma-semialdehyde dehydrogenase PutA [Sphingomonas]KZE08604.1 integrase [Sphingomonas hankookensis]PZT92749.1 MAG: bifunctional proline dehydrogenase/L-glutamate gamma-semialdehyde dehydrogenase PutA [Sphingomonas sp.]RSV31892.1 bifunctional proline dehydrogenase/L-glutamate gamma-semialdehyde dehydrogenase PutA [Sphingomonas sp. ABOLH]WCP71362.1 bifunctional proline dehydrogenase/L-glutamate gamma-semialdehyde dehydrogenase PutA 